MCPLAVIRGPWLLYLREPGGTGVPGRTLEVAGELVEHPCRVSRDPGPPSESAGSPRGSISEPFAEGIVDSSRRMRLGTHGT